MSQKTLDSYYTTRKRNVNKDIGKKHVIRSPKRNLSSPDEPLPPKKKPQPSKSARTRQKKSATSVVLPNTSNKNIPEKLQLVAEGNACKEPKIKELSSEVQNKDNKNSSRNHTLFNKDNEKLATLVNESRSKILFSSRLDDLKKSLERFSEVSSKVKEFQSNSFKITSVICTKSAEKSSDSSSLIPKVPAYEKFSHLASSEFSSSLILPYKYKFLAEKFRCMDTVVSMLNNRKERINFDKVQKGVQKMMGRNFTEIDLAQIITVLPSAYTLNWEKCNSNFIKKSDTPNFELVICPILTKETDVHKLSFTPCSSKSTAIPHMSPQCLLLRKDSFNQNLLKLVKMHHQAFLAKENFPPISDDSIVRWHPKFPLDTVPDVPAATLPEMPESKVCTAKDVLNKIKGAVHGRVEKALKSVADESKSSLNTSNTEASSNSSKSNSSSSALKGICTDLLEKIRARESAKLLEVMTRSPQEAKRRAMLQRLEKIIPTLWHYFISERKAAVPVDVAVEKIIHSFKSLTTPDDVREHLELITEVFPGWLSFIKIPKGEYITMDKKKNIHVMLDNLKSELG